MALCQQLGSVARAGFTASAGQLGAAERVREAKTCAAEIRLELGQRRVSSPCLADIAGEWAVAIAVAARFAKTNIAERLVAVPAQNPPACAPVNMHSVAPEQSSTQAPVAGVTPAALVVMQKPKHLSVAAVGSHGALPNRIAGRLGGFAGSLYWVAE